MEYLIRKSLETDFEQILGMILLTNQKSEIKNSRANQRREFFLDISRNVYGGRDYLPKYLKHWLQDENRFNFVVCFQETDSQSDFIRSDPTY